MLEDRKIEYDLAQMEEVMPAPDLNLPDITVKKCMRPKDGRPYLVFFCKPSGKYIWGCRTCGSLSIIGHGPTSTPRLVHDVNIGIQRVDLVIDVPRYLCKDCGAGFRHEFDSIPVGKQHTVRLYEQIRRDAFLRPFSDVAADFGYSEGTIRNIFDEYAEELEAKRGPIIAPEVLGIDEKHIEHTARGVFVDIQTGRLLEMTPDNKEKDILGTIENMVDYDKNIRLVTIDMANGYRAQIQMCLPYAKIIVDKYHVYQDLYRKISTARTAIMSTIAVRIKATDEPMEKEFLKSIYDLVAHNAYLFKFGKKKLSESERRMSIMLDVCRTFPEFNHLRLIKEGFERIYDESNTREKAESLYEEWVQLIPPRRGTKKIAEWERRYGVNASLYSELVTFYNTTRNWHQEIFNYFDEGCQFTNAASEGTNSMIQRINAQGSGYGFKRLRAKALCWSNAGPRITYGIKLAKKKASSGSGYDSVTMYTEGIGTHSLFPYKPGWVAKYIDIPQVTKAVEEATGGSVLAFLNEEDEFYEFD